MTSAANQIFLRFYIVKLNKFSVGQMATESVYRQIWKIIDNFLLEDIVVINSAECFRKVNKNTFSLDIYIHFIFYTFAVVWSLEALNFELNEHVRSTFFLWKPIWFGKSTEFLIRSFCKWKLTTFSKCFGWVGSVD